MSRLVFDFLICVFVTASFVDTYSDGYNDYNDAQEQDENVVQQLRHLFHNYKYNKENRRNIGDEFDHWNGRWMPDRPDDPRPPPKVFPKNSQQYEYGPVPELSHEVHWAGRWMPDRPNDPTPPPKVLPKSMQQYEYESVTEFPHEIHMGEVLPECDDAKTNLTVDWDYSPAEYTCFHHDFVPKQIEPRLYCETIPKTYRAIHKCMNEEISYDSEIPLYGTHRPLWPVYGEYKYVPKQRWLHSLEHGAIVMLYHPCANPLEVNRLRHLVKGCLWRHIITPYSYLSMERPLALLSWGCKLTMSYVNPFEVELFIRKKALRGPENVTGDGQYKEALLVRSEIVTDPEDSMLCP